MSELALRLRGVRKRYGKQVALDGLDLDVPKGSVLGLVGPNGAGKTTTFGIVSGAVRSSSGSVEILGEGPFDSARHAGRVAVLPQDCELNPHSSARQLLGFYAQLQGLSKKRAITDAERVLELVQLKDRGDARVKELSHGMRRRLAVAQAFLGEPELVLLDEPTGGLDPHLVVDMRDLLRSQAGQRTVVVSTHILGDIESTCDHVAFMDAGRCVRSGPIAEMTKRLALVRIRLGAAPELEHIERVLSGRDPQVDGLDLCYSLHPGEDASSVQPALLAALIERGVQVLEVRLGESLESVYLESRR